MFEACLDKSRLAKSWVFMKPAPGGCRRSTGFRKARFLAINLPSYMYEHGAHPDAAAIGMTTQISLAFHESMAEHNLVASLGVGLGFAPHRASR